MKIRLLTDLPNICPLYKAGDVIDCNEAEGARYIKDGTAKKYVAPKKRNQD